MPVTEPRPHWPHKSREDVIALRAQVADVDGITAADDEGYLHRRILEVIDAHLRSGGDPRDPTTSHSAIVAAVVGWTGEVAGGADLVDITGEVLDALGAYAHDPET